MGKASADGAPLAENCGAALNDRTWACGEFLRPLSAERLTGS
jgi:hypothetical protein